MAWRTVPVLKVVLAAVGLSQTELRKRLSAKGFSIDAGGMSRIVSGDRPPAIGLVEAISEIVGVRPEVVWAGPLPAKRIIGALERVAKISSAPVMERLLSRFGLESIEQVAAGGKKIPAPRANVRPVTRAELRECARLLGLAAEDLQELSEWEVLLRLSKRTSGAW